MIAGQTVDGDQIEGIQVRPVRRRLPGRGGRPPIGGKGEALTGEDSLGQQIVGNLVLGAR